MMKYESLTKPELISILEDKELVASTLEAQKAKKELSGDLKRALLNARCRLCVSESFEVPVDTLEFPEERGHPDDPDYSGKPLAGGKTLVHRGTPIAASRGGNKLACRACKHVRRALKDAGETDLYI